MNTLRSMRPAVAPMLSTKWMARRELPAVLCAGLPAVMMGPEDDDQQSDNEDDVDDTDPDYVPGACLTPLVVVVCYVCCVYGCVILSLPVCMYVCCVYVCMLCVCMYAVCMYVCCVYVCMLCVCMYAVCMDVSAALSVWVTDRLCLCLCM
jgi:hypothetical protein